MSEAHFCVTAGRTILVREVLKRGTLSDQRSDREQAWVLSNQRVRRPF